MSSSFKKIIPVKAGIALKELYLKIRMYYYRGDNYYCPICQHGYKTFLTGGFDLPVIREKQIVGAGKREQNICPGCLSTDRDRLVYLYLHEKTDFFKKPQKVLHIAPEPALYKVFRKLKNLDYIAGTKYQEGFYYSDKLMVLDITALDFADEQFDFVMANHILEHIENDRKAMQEIYRVLKPNGQAILQVPIALALNKTYENPLVKTEKEREKHFGQFDHVRLYAEDYKERLEKAGFDVLKTKPGTSQWPMKNIKRYGLNKNEYLYVAIKKSL